MAKSSDLIFCFRFCKSGRLAPSHSSSFLVPPLSETPPDVPVDLFFEVLLLRYRPGAGVDADTIQISFICLVYVILPLFGLLPPSILVTKVSSLIAWTDHGKAFPSRPARRGFRFPRSTLPATPRSVFSFRPLTIIGLRKNV